MNFIKRNWILLPIISVFGGFLALIYYIHIYTCTHADIINEWLDRPITDMTVREVIFIVWIVVLLIIIFRNDRRG